MNKGRINRTKAMGLKTKLMAFRIKAIFPYSGYFQNDCVQSLGQSQTEKDSHCVTEIAWKMTGKNVGENWFSYTFLCMY